MSKFTKRVELYLENIKCVSHGPCPGCSECKEVYDYETQEELNEAISSGKLPTEPHFSSSPCDICGTHLGGDRYDWHYMDDGEIVHEYNMCSDCVNYIMTGYEPEE